MLDGSYDRRLSFASRSFLDSDDNDRHGKSSRDERVDQSTDSFIDSEHLPLDAHYSNPSGHPPVPHVISERNTKV